MRGNGGVTGVINTPSGGRASGIWSLDDFYAARLQNRWPGQNIVEYLLIAGGGAGGYNNSVNIAEAGGGGAGGVVGPLDGGVFSAFSAIPGVNYSIFVGGGGPATSAGADTRKGAGSYIVGIASATGGGGGGSTGESGGNGGSGGGGGSDGTSLYLGGNSTGNQGKNGGSGSSGNTGGGGGGGYSSPGGPGVTDVGGSGGVGYDLTSFRGSGALWITPNLVAGGGGGGDTGIGTFGGGNATANGVDGTGGGGGGAQVVGPGAAGGSGIVILRYPVGSLTGTASGGLEGDGGSNDSFGKTVTISGVTYKIHTFKASGTVTAQYNFIIL